MVQRQRLLLYGLNNILKFVKNCKNSPENEKMSKKQKHCKKRKKCHKAKNLYKAQAV
jgi:hypothetical protein